MGILKYFNKDEYSNLGDVFGYIKKELQALQVKDSADIVWSKSANGISASLRRNGVQNETQQESDTDIQVADTSYNGYFTCKLLDRDENDINNNQVRVAVCDGETWDEEKETSYKSIAKINGVSKEFESTIITLTRTTRQIVLRYDFSKDEATICAVSELSNSFYTFTDYLIGEYVEVNNMYKMVQRHTSGVLLLNTYANLCLVGEYIDE